MNKTIIATLACLAGATTTSSQTKTTTASKFDPDDFGIGDLIGAFGDELDDDEDEERKAQEA